MAPATTDRSRAATGAPGERFVVISGCSGGGKSALLSELSQRAHVVVEESGRRIVQDELQRGGSALPWLNPIDFARRALATAIMDHGSQAASVRQRGWVFFDRSIVDAAAAIAYLTGEPALAMMEQTYRYHRRVFLTPPWPELYSTDEARRHDFDAALGEYAHLLEVYPSLGYEVYILPKVGISERADYLLEILG
jgi:predicted ATPase